MNLLTLQTGPNCISHEMNGTPTCEADQKWCSTLPFSFQDLGAFHLDLFILWLWFQPGIILVCMWIIACLAVRDDAGSKRRTDWTLWDLKVFALPLFHLATKDRLYLYTHTSFKSAWRMRYIGILEANLRVGIITGALSQEVDKKLMTMCTALRSLLLWMFHSSSFVWRAWSWRRLSAPSSC